MSLEIYDKQKNLSFSELFEGEVKSLIEKTFKILYTEGDSLYFSLLANEEEKSLLRTNWGLIKNKCLTSLNVKQLNNVSVEEEKLLFLEKAIEICKAKEVRISLV